MAANSNAVRSHLPLDTVPAEATPKAANPEPATTVARLERRRRSIAELVPASLRHDMIASAAYQRAAERGFAAGHELEDWLAAERDVDETLRARYT